MTVDCIIIGSGIIGMMTARELSKAGLNVQILEKGQSGRESSWAGGGLLSPIYPWDTPEQIWPMLSQSQKAYPILCEQLMDETGIEPQWIQSGLLNFDPVDNKKLSYWAEKTDSDYSILNRKQISEIEPVLEQIFNLAIWLPDVAQVRNPRLLKALKKSLLLNGVQIKEGIEVSSINKTNGRIDSVTSSEGRIDCKFVVVAAGAWSGRFLKQKTIIEPVRGQVLRIEVPAGFLTRILLKDGTYLIPRNDGQLLIGSTLEYVGFDKGVTEDVAKKLYTEAISILPSLRGYSIAEQWSGLRPGTASGIPIIEESSETKGLFINSGHFRNGVALAPASSEIIVDMMLNQRRV